MAVLMPILNPFIDIIVERVAERVLSIAETKEPKFYSRKETAQLLHVTLPTLARLTKDGLITAKKVGSRILYEAGAIDEAVKENRMFKYKRTRYAQKRTLKKFWTSFAIRLALHSIVCLLLEFYATASRGMSVTWNALVCCKPFM